MVTYRSNRVLTRREALKIVGYSTAGLVIAACGGSGKQGGISARPTGDAPVTAGGAATGYSARFAAFEAAPEPNADLSKIVWPNFVTQAGPEVRGLYEFQLTHGELMRYMPCFCGCGSDGHRSNRDCYVKTVNADGTAVLDPMAPT